MKKETILVVDDSPLVLEVISKFLRNNGYETITATHGIEAIEKTFKELPDLILLDVMMPKMNGYQTCRLLKTDPETSSVPIIMLTVKDQASDKYWGMQTGADAYLTKESELTLLLETIKGLLEKKQKVVQKASLIRRNSLINAVDIVTKVNDLLDRKLFEATVLNEMNSLIEKGLDDFKATVELVMGTLAKIMDYHVAAFVALEEQNAECFFKINHTVSEHYLNEVQEYTRDLLKSQDIFLSPGLGISVLDADKVTQANNEKEQKKYFYNVPIRYVNRLGGMVILAHDIAERMEDTEEEFFRTVVKQAYVIMENSWLYNKVKRLAITDSLTGIYNHGFLYEVLNKEYAKAVRDNLSLSFMMLDLDYFKRLNDTYGHLQGDTVLYALSQILKTNVRIYDTVGRYGGEEFAIVLQDTRMEECLTFAERIRKNIEQHNFGDGNREIHCTTSIGIAHYPGTDIKNVDDLISKADKALYKAKGDGRNRVCIL